MRDIALLRDAVLAAAVFGGAACLLSMTVALLFDAGLAGIGALGAIPSAAVVAALWSPRLVADAARPSRRGVWNGTLITCTAYALGAAFVMTWIPVAGGMGVRVEFFFVAVLAGILLVPVALPFGMIAGWVFDGYLRSTSQNHAEPTPQRRDVFSVFLDRLIDPLFASSSPVLRQKLRRRSFSP